MGKNKNIRYELCRKIENQWTQGRGTSKKSARARAAADGRKSSPYIHSDSTKENYIASCKQFASWIKEQHPEAYKDISAARLYIPEWLLTHSNAGTRMTHAAALAKAYGLSSGSSWGVELGRRPLNEITRGRTLSDRQREWRENHAAAAEALRSCGLRRSEAEALRGRDVYQRSEDGAWVVHVQSGKGGLERESVIWTGSENTAGLDWLKAAAEAAGRNGYIFADVPDLKNANIHAFRAEYAYRMYDLYLNDGKTATGEFYKPRNGAGEWDKGCLTAVNGDLGHGDNRFSTIYYNYLSYGK